MSFTKLSYREALAEAIRMEMHRDPSVVCLAGSVAGSPVADLDAAFGSDRIIDPGPGVPPLPIAVGMAARGMRVICEARPERLAPAGLVTVGELGEDEGTLVLRIPHGGHTPAGPSLPHGIEGWLLDTPDLAVAAPSTPADAKGLMATAIRGSGPVCVLEQEALYAIVDDVPEGSHITDLGNASVSASGSRLSVIAYGLGATVAAAAIERSQVEAELVDLRSIRPLDRNALAGSVGRTGKVAVVEPPGSTRVGAEVAAVLLTDAFEYLDGPMKRIEVALEAGIDEDVLEEAIDRLAEEIDDLVTY